MTVVDYSRVPETREADQHSPLGEKLEALWETKPGFIGALGSVDHKEIGIRYLVTAMAFLVLGGLEALVMRVQLARPNQNLLTPEQYNQLFSTHGITMIFLYALPVLSGFSNYLFPLVLGSRDMAFPRVNALSYWVYLAAGLFLYLGVFVGAMPNDGWFNYVPYANRQYNPGPNEDIYSLGMILLGISTTVGAMNFVVTFLRHRCPGMSINRIPIIVWGTRDRERGEHLLDSGRQPGIFPAVDGPELRHPFLRRRRRRAAAALAAPVLDVRPSLGLHHRAPRDGHGVGCAAGVLPEAARRLHLRGARHRDHDDHRLRRLGASHVRHRPAERVAVVLQRRLDPDHDPERGRGLRLDRDDLDGHADLQDADAVLRRLHGDVRDRRRVGLHDGCRPGRLAADRHVFRRRPPPLRPARHQSVSRS